MKYICLDFRSRITIAEVHEVFNIMLDFPDYYGNNYNALYDELSTVHEDIEINVIIKEKDLDEWEILRRVLANAANDNKRITLKGKIVK